MAEPQPSSIQEGAADPHAPSGTAEDRKTAAALQSLDARDDTSEKKDVDSTALNEAMKGLNVQGQKEEEEKKKKAVKIEAGDIALLVSELEISKQKATELLRAHGSDAIKAMVAFVSAPA